MFVYFAVCLTFTHWCFILQKLFRPCYNKVLWKNDFCFGIKDLHIVKKAPNFVFNGFFDNIFLKLFKSRGLNTRTQSIAGQFLTQSSSLKKLERVDWIEIRKDSPQILPSVYVLAKFRHTSSWRFSRSISLDLFEYRFISHWELSKEN